MRRLPPEDPVRQHRISQNHRQHEQRADQDDIHESDPAARAAGRLLLEDEKTFITLPKSPLWWGEEKVIIDGAV